VATGAVPRDGRGGLVTVPRDIVAAAGPECSARPYTRPDNCRPADRPAGGTLGLPTGDTVLVASAASRYHPAYYWVVGTAAGWTHGSAAVYVMRVTSALLCAAFTGLAGWSLTRWARTGWPAAALVGSLTPVVAYSAVVVAPNALEIAAATSVWVALAGLARGGLPVGTERALLWAAVPGAVVLATVRSLGTGFLGLVVLVLLLVLGWSRAKELAGRHRGTLRAAAAVVGAAVVAGLGWLLSAAPNRLEEHGDYPGAVAGSLVQLPVWVLQTVAAAPGRADPAPGPVYVLCGGVLAVLAVLGLRRAEPRLRRVVLGVAFLSLGLPLLLTLRTYAEVGVIWQGRYGLPFSVGVLVLCGLALDRTTASPRRAVLGAAVALFAVGQLLAVLHVLGEQRRVSPSVALGLWSPPSPWLVASLVLLGWAVVAVALLRHARGPGDAGPVDGPRTGAEDSPLGQLRAVR
jgi:hypothetical protein